MKLIKFIFLILSFSTAKATFDLQKAKNEFNKEFASINSLFNTSIEQLNKLENKEKLKNISQEKVSEVFDYFKAQCEENHTLINALQEISKMDLYDNKHDRTVIENIFKPNQFYLCIKSFSKFEYKQVEYLSHFFNAHKRIYELNDDVINIFFNEKVCNDQTNKYRCSQKHSIKGLYHPYLNAIFIRPDLNYYEFHSTLFHELYHAYQYHFRFISDLKNLEKLTKDNRINLTNRQINELLNYFYEAQAHWMSLKTGFYNKNIKNVFQQPTDSQVFSKIADFLKLNTTAQKNNELLNKYLPTFDQQKFLSAANSTSEKNLYFNEYLNVAQLNLPFFLTQANNLGVNINLKSSEIFIKALGKAYFNKPESFISDNQLTEQKIALYLNQTYWNEVLKNSSFYQKAEFYKKIDEILFQKQSVYFFNYLLIKYSPEIQDKPDFFQTIKPLEYLNHLYTQDSSLDSTNHNSGFDQRGRGDVDGGEGTRPDIELNLPPLNIHPNIEIGE